MKIKWTPNLLRMGLNIYGPFLGAGIKVTYISEDWHEMHVRMKMRFYNRNIVGTHFGGSLYAMVDPQLMVMLMHILGRDYIVWDKAAEIDFVRPGKATVTAKIKMDPIDVDKIKKETMNGEKYFYKQTVEVVDSENNIVTNVNKTIYIKKKSAR